MLWVNELCFDKVDRQIDLYGVREFVGFRRVRLLLESE